MSFERALLLLKPDVVQKEDEILYVLNRNGFKIANRAKVRLSEEHCVDLFQEYMDMPTFNDMITHLIRYNVDYLS